MSIQQKEKFVAKAKALFEKGYKSETVVAVLCFKNEKPEDEDGNIMVEGLPHPLKKAQANNLVRRVRKDMEIFKPLGDEGNYILQDLAKTHRKRQAAMQKSFNASANVIKANHSDDAVADTVEAQLDRIIDESEVSAQTA